MAELEEEDRVKLPSFEEFQNTIIGQMCTVAGALAYIAVVVVAARSLVTLMLGG